VRIPTSKTPSQEQDDKNRGEERTPDKSMSEIFECLLCGHVQPATVSVIVPVLNEAHLIERFLLRLRERAPDAEIIVVDGGSDDETAHLAAGLADQVLISARGRAVQMNVGARAAGGELLWFLHVDVEPPPRSLEEIVRVMNEPRNAGGFFRIRLPRSEFVYRLSDAFAHYAGILLRLRCGDHGLFCRREIFDAIGGFPEVPLLEDIEFFRQLRRQGRVVTVRRRLIASTRRYEKIGPWRVTLAYGLIAALYTLRVPLPRLAAIYQRTCCRT
jgi:rSAM/selenodomain-associated transferase 2